MAPDGTLVKPRPQHRMDCCDMCFLFGREIALCNGKGFEDVGCRNFDAETVW